MSAARGSSDRNAPLDASAGVHTAHLALPQLLGLEALPLEAAGPAAAEAAQLTTATGDAQPPPPSWIAWAAHARGALDDAADATRAGLTIAAIAPLYIVWVGFPGSLVHATFSSFRIGRVLGFLGTGVATEGMGKDSGGDGAKKDGGGSVKPAQATGTLAKPPAGKAGGGPGSAPLVPGLAKPSPRGQASPASHRAAPPVAAAGGTAKSSARGKQQADPLGAKALGSARGKGAKSSGGGSNPLGGVSAASARVSSKEGTGGSGGAPGQPTATGGGSTARGSSAPSKPPSAPAARKASPRVGSAGQSRGGDEREGGGKKHKEEPLPENPCLVTAPVPPFPPNCRRPPYQIISPAGPRPRGRQDGAPSRHDLAPGLGAALLFNCFKAKFEVISGDVSTLSDHDPFDLKGPRSGISLGRIKISPEKGTSLVDRVEFPNVWLSAEQHGCLHDAYQGEGALDLKIEWKKESGGSEAAIIRVTPWLAYACSLGARFQLRKPGDADGRACTVQRVLPDDRCVVRVDGMSGADPKKTPGNAEDVVDAAPSSCISTSYPKHPCVAIPSPNLLPPTPEPRTRMARASPPPRPATARACGRRPLSVLLRRMQIRRLPVPEV